MQGSDEVTVDKGVAVFTGTSLVGEPGKASYFVVAAEDMELESSPRKCARVVLHLHAQVHM